MNSSRVFLSKYGMHTAVAFPGNDTSYVEFGFGEWHYYGLEQHGFGSSLRAVTGGGSGALSRREVAVTSLDDEAFAAAAGAEKSAGIDVDAAKMLAVREGLEQRWALSVDRVFRKAEGKEVRRDTQGYHILANSNAVAADWMRQMGTEVRGLPVWSNFEVATVPSE